jgi:hypothetical protein
MAMADSLYLLFKLSGLWLLIAALSIFLAATAYGSFHRLIAAADPAFRAACRLAFGLAPLLVASAVIVLVTHPALASLLIPDVLIPDHCHGAACGSHVPAVRGGSWASGALAAFGGLTLLVAVAATVALILHAYGRVRMVRRLTRLTDSAGAFRVVESGGTLACCIGLWRTEVLISRGVLNKLDDAELAAVLAHERAHAMRHDNLQGFVLHTVTRPWPSVIRERIRQDHASDAEQACDRVAERVTGSRGTVASAIHALAATLPRTEPNRAVAFGSADPAARLAALEQPRQAARQAVHAMAGVAVLVLLGALLTGALTGFSHWFMEWLVAVGW